MASADAASQTWGMAAGLFTGRVCVACLPGE